jgi:single-stranded-DNA-specific exonuclease
VHRPWTLKAIDAQASARLTRELGVHHATARWLVGRGFVEPGHAQAFLKPRLAELRSPRGAGGIAGFDQAIERLVRALGAGERVGVFGDYDVDGVTTTALLTLYLRTVGLDVVPKVARRDAGYGFGVDDANGFVERGCGLIVTCDCGTSDLPAILAARARGADVIVLDHHQVPSQDEVHPAIALLNPHRADSSYPFRGFASVGLAFMLVAALRTRLREAGHFARRPDPDVRELLDLVAVGTIADMAPLSEENRTLVVAGLAKLAERRRPGLAALLDRAEVQRGKPLDEIDVSWRLGPRLNAPGRLGDAEPALRLLMAADSTQAAAEVEVLESCNQKRRELQEHVVEEALADAERQAHRAAILVAREGWHPGVVGIVAAKLVEKYGRPVAVVALDAATGQGRGSVRTAHGVDVYRALAACSEQLVRYGGHAAAAGMTVENTRIDELAERFAAAVAAARDEALHAAPLELDAEIGLGDVDEKLAREIASLAPFGPGNAAPAIGARRALVRDSRRVGDGSHLKMQLECASTGRACSAIAFRMGDRDPGVGATIDVLFQPEISTYRGESRVELKVRDLRPSV